jgi:transcriptional regulator with XRE-family HTH domain
MTGGSPTVRRRRLGMELRRLREAAGHQIDRVAEYMECSRAKISRIETGQVGVKAPELRALLDLYGVPDAGRDGLLTLARESRQRGWWSSYADVTNIGLGSFIGMEAAAASIRTYEQYLLPGLLQIEEYTRALMRAAHPTAGSDEIDRRVALRMTRQERLGGPDALNLWAVIDEAALRRRVGGAGVMRMQLERLVESAGQPNITVQVLPFSAGAHAGVEGSVLLMSFPEPSDPDVAYVEGLMGSIFLEKSDEIARCTLAFDHLRATALSPDDSVAMISAVTKDLVDR